MVQPTPHDPTFFLGFAAGTTTELHAIFSAPTDMTSNPAANILHRTPFPVAWCPWVPPTGVDPALSSMSWQHHFIAIKLKNIAIKCDELPLAFLAAYRGCLATKGGVADALSFPRAGKVVESRRAFMLSPGRPVARGGVGRCDDHIFVVEQSASVA